MKCAPGEKRNVCTVLHCFLRAEVATPVIVRRYLRGRSLELITLRRSSRSLFFFLMQLSSFATLTTRAVLTFFQSKTTIFLPSAFIFPDIYTAYANRKGKKTPNAHLQHRCRLQENSPAIKLNCSVCGHSVTACSLHRVSVEFTVSPKKRKQQICIRKASLQDQSIETK